MLSHSTRPESLSIFVLGGAAFSYGQRAVRIKSRRSSALLAYLALSENREVTRERLVGLFWSEFDETRGRASLRQVLRELQRALLEVGYDGLQVDRFKVALALDSVDVDVWSVVREAESYQVHPLALNRKRLIDGVLEGFEDIDPAFRVWLLAKRQTLQDRLLRAFESGLGHDSANVRNRKLLAEAIINLDPTHEEAYRQLMQMRVEDGDVASALRVYKTLWDLLESEYDMEPSPKTQQLIIDIKQGNISVGLRQWDFFLSYSREDEAFAQWIAQIVRAVGFSVFAQHDAILPAGSFGRERELGLDQSGGFIALQSPSYIESNDCQVEWRRAFERYSDNKAMRIVQLLIRPTTLPSLARQFECRSLVGISASEVVAIVLQSIGYVGPMPKVPVGWPGYLAMEGAHSPANVENTAPAIPLPVPSPATRFVYVNGKFDVVAPVAWENNIGQAAIYHARARLLATDLAGRLEKTDALPDVAGAVSALIDVLGPTVANVQPDQLRLASRSISSKARTYGHPSAEWEISAESVSAFFELADVLTDLQSFARTEIEAHESAIRELDLTPHNVTEAKAGLDFVSEGVSATRELLSERVDIAFKSAAEVSDTASDEEVKVAVEGDRTLLTANLALAVARELGRSAEREAIVGGPPDKPPRPPLESPPEKPEKPKRRRRAQRTAAASEQSWDDFAERFMARIHKKGPDAMADATIQAAASAIKYGPKTAAALGAILIAWSVSNPLVLAGGGIAATMAWIGYELRRRNVAEKK
jgi:DNA-binding SARP family transcriptional activator